MFKKLFFIGLLLTATTSFAEPCPTIAEIKAGFWHGWQPLNLDSGSLISPSALAYFKNNVQNFALAEWMKDAPEGEAHCYYNGDDKKDNTYLGVFLTKENLTADTTSLAWHKLNKNILQCRISLQTCQFITTK